MDEFKEAMINAEIVEYYEDDYPLPSALVLGCTCSGRPLHAVAAMEKDDEMLWIITLYEPKTGLWDEQFKNRRISHGLPSMQRKNGAGNNYSSIRNEKW